MKLRPYQEEAVASIYRHLRERDDNPCAVLPTGSGKTHVMSTICKDAVGKWKGRVLILAHVKELLEQAVEKVKLVAPELRQQIGVYSAGLKRRDTKNPIIVAGIQSVFKRACELGAFDIAVIDEAHMIPPDGDGMYRTFIKDSLTVNPDLRVIGLTATPFRMKSGMICAPENVLNHVCYEIGVKELIVGGHLCPLFTKAGREKIDTSGIQIRAGEFVASEAEELMDTDELVESACSEIVKYARMRRSVLIFATGVKHGQHIAEVMRKKFDADVATVFGDTPSLMRNQTLDDFREGKLKYLVNVNVLTMGFDVPAIDCVAMVRPTMSPGLYYQMVGRGFRMSEGKDDCLILDFGGNVLRHGPVDDIQLRKSNQRGNGEAPAKECPECHSLIAAGYSVCPNCGHEFPPPQRQQHEGKASTEGILSGQSTTTDYEVRDVSYTVHQKRGAPDDAPKTMRVEYRLGLNQFLSEWICFEHTGWPRKKAESWWRQRSSASLPDTAGEAVELANAGALCTTGGIRVRSITGEDFDRIVGYVLGEKPWWREPGWDEDEVAVEETEYVNTENIDAPF